MLTQACSLFTASAHCRKVFWIRSKLECAQNAVIYLSPPKMCVSRLHASAGKCTTRSVDSRIRTEHEKHEKPRASKHGCRADEEMFWGQQEFSVFQPGEKEILRSLGSLTMGNFTLKFHFLHSLLFYEQRQHEWKKLDKDHRYERAPLSYVLLRTKLEFDCWKVRNRVSIQQEIKVTMMLVARRITQTSNLKSRAKLLSTWIHPCVI